VGKIKKKGGAESKAFRPPPFFLIFPLNPPNRFTSNPHDSTSPHFSHFMLK